LTLRGSPSSGCQLTRQQEKSIFLILDNLRMHHSKRVRKWLDAIADKKGGLEIQPLLVPRLGQYGWQTLPGASATEQ
jgi:hypothetical protein